MGLLQRLGNLVRLGIKSKSIDLVKEKATNPNAMLIFCTLTHTRWPQAEKEMLKSPRWAYFYALQMMDDEKWPEAEPIIASNGYWAEAYALNSLKHRWPEAEENIFDPKQNSNPSGYYEDFLSDLDFDELPTGAQYWLRSQRGACDYCGTVLPKSIWTTGETDGRYCSEQCADRAVEDYYESAQKEEN